MHSRKKQFLNATQALRWMRNWIFDRISSSSQWSLNMFVSQSKYMYLLISRNHLSQLRATQKRLLNIIRAFALSSTEIRANENALTTVNPSPEDVN